MAAAMTPDKHRYELIFNQMKADIGERCGWEPQVPPLACTCKIECRNAGILTVRGVLVI